MGKGSRRMSKCPVCCGLGLIVRPGPSWSSDPELPWRPYETCQLCGEPVAMARTPNFEHVPTRADFEAGRVSAYPRI